MGIHTIITRLVCLGLLLLMPLPLWGCTPEPSQPPSETTPGTQTGILFQGEPGWQDVGGSRYYFHDNGAMATGLTEINGQTYFFGTNGIMATGWVEVDGNELYFGADGRKRTGWAEKDGIRCYILSDGTLASGWLEERGQRYYLDASGPRTGWQEIDGQRCYFQESGALLVGWAKLGGKTYYFEQDGTPATGWVEEGGKKYYFLQDGTAATGPMEIDGQTYYFTPHGVNVILVNPWNYVPADYAPDLVYIDEAQQVDRSCYDALMQMLADCSAAGHSPLAVSCYRTQGTQRYLYNRKVEYYLEKGYGTADAQHLAGQVVAVPGTSEHQLGLAIDICDKYYAVLDEAQSQTETQKWLMAHCWEYGFILRYPVEATDITGIIYEPWHYRYVGTEIALELRDLGITLEEYLGAA